MHRSATLKRLGPAPVTAQRKLGLIDWLVVQAVTVGALVAALLIGGAPLGTALLGAWLMSGLVALGIAKAAIDLAR